MIVDLFAGPGGWDQGAAMIGRTDTVGLEWDDAACATATAAGHLRIQTDVARYPTAQFAGCDALIASPPCQAWSMAGNRKGELDRANCHVLADRMAAGDDSIGWTEWEDPRSALVCQPVRWARDLRPPVIALEEVPAVEGLWQHFARIFRGWGYSTWVKVLCAADYGVPQTRNRVILGASLLGRVAPPEPTHDANDHSEDLFGGERLPWVTMAQALGWGFDDEPACTVSSGGAATGGAEPFANANYRRRLSTYVKRERSGDRADETFDAAEVPAQTLTSKTRSWERLPDFAVSAGVTGKGRPKRVDTQPADTLTGKGTAYWCYDRPATTIVGSFSPDVVAAPGYRTAVSRQNAEGSVRISVQEGGVLQSFPADYPWQGSRSKQYEQVGNAVPPLLAAHVLASLGLSHNAQEIAA